LQTAFTSNFSLHEVPAGVFVAAGSGS